MDNYTYTIIDSQPRTSLGYYNCNMFYKSLFPKKETSHCFTKIPSLPFHVSSTHLIYTLIPTCTHIRLPLEIVMVSARAIHVDKWSVVWFCSPATVFLVYNSVRMRTMRNTLYMYAKNCRIVTGLVWRFAGALDTFGVRSKNNPTFPHGETRLEWFALCHPKTTTHHLG